MDIKKLFTAKRLIFLTVFLVLVLIAQRINFSPLLGAENQFFTVFQFFGPIAGSFLGSIFGIITVFLAEITDFLIVGKTFSLINVLRLLPMLFAVYYFSSFKDKNKKFSAVISVLIPLACLALFVLHPVGRQAWFFSLYWLIPVLGVLLPQNWPGQLFFRSYGATFTAHAVGGAIWVYTVPMTAAQWISLIPVVAYERFLFGLGIAGSYVVFNAVLDYLIEKFNFKVPSSILFLDKNYSLFKSIVSDKNK